MPRPRQSTTIEELLDRVVVSMSACWIWAGGDSGSEGRGAGYGRILRPGTRNAMAAHRYVYETFVGPIPAGWHVDHRCAAWHCDPFLSRRCVNPDHLEAVPPGVNIVRRNHHNAMTRELPVDEIEDSSPRPDPLLAPGERVEDWVL